MEDNNLLVWNGTGLSINGKDIDSSLLTTDVPHGNLTTSIDSNYVLGNNCSSIISNYDYYGSTLTAQTIDIGTYLIETLKGTDEEIAETVKKKFYDYGFNIIGNSNGILDVSKLRGWTVYGKVNPANSNNDSVLQLEIERFPGILSAYDEITIRTDESVFFDKFTIKLVPSSGLVFVDNDEISDYYKLEEESDIIIGQIQEIINDLRAELLDYSYKIK